MYFNYHAVVKRKIKEGLLLHLERIEKDPSKGVYLVLYFKDGTKYPIKEERIAEYLEFIKNK